MEECPACRNPIGGSLKELRAERDRLISFVTQQSALQLRIKQQESDLKERQSLIDSKEKIIQLKEDSLLLNERALDELLKEAKRPEEEFKKLEAENLQIITELEYERGKYKLQDEKRKSEILANRLKIEELKKIENEHNKKIKRLPDDLKSSNYYRDTYKSKFYDISKKYTDKTQENEKLNNELITCKRDHANLLRENTSNVALISGLKTKNENFEGQLKKVKSELSEVTAKFSEVVTTQPRPAPTKISSAFNDLEVVDCLSVEITEQFHPPSDIVTIGHGPFPEYDFDAYLVSLNITPRYDGYPWIIVGRVGWDKDKLIELIEEYDSDVVVMSQEIFAGGIMTGHDPFSLPIEILMKFADGHPALEFLMRYGFDWPEILIEDLNHSPAYLRGPSVSYDRVEMSPIYSMGYVVGVTNGISFKKRTKILESALDGDIPWVGDDEYMKEWGKPSSRRRLWRTAHHLAWLIRSRKSNPTMRYAVRDWKEDLDWLGENFGNRGLGFSWPNI
jgi:hypothetical protein